MLVLSRKVRESLVIDDVLVFTVDRIRSDSVDVSLSTIEGGRLRRLTLRRNQPAAVRKGIDVTLIESRGDKVRLGISSPPDARPKIERRSG